MAGKSKLIQCLENAEKSLRQLRNLCDMSSRGGKTVRRVQAYKNAVEAERFLREEISEIVTNSGSSAKSKQETKSISLFIIIDS
jgi:hypothetical protein